ncbi:MAG: prepilin-type N-terminal cleavage/methylation domain-containing protein [bacterium]
MKNIKKGFTLIELLVVVAIIALLTMVVLAALNSARNKGSDSTVKAQLSGMRAQAEMYYNTNSTYDGVCATSGTNVVGLMANAAEKAYNGTTSVTTYADGNPSTWTTAQCHDGLSGWVVWVPLKTSGNAWCVDYTGAAKISTNLLLAVGTFPTGYVCP